ncbi:hypothetical protein LXM94_01940 [Rhizobium sp. TRM95111]|uniref:hypothetical protein n=1 Tax=Rhizobium alarense TaxID=2846851 RepID=UPI001F39BECD|nr:hypothetical protein [Rhizobium alarense]MCF3638732.1 hypothetical protein [Rhizobium alarense]
MGALAKLVRTAPEQDDPLRIELRRAIESHASAKQERDRICAALEQAERRTWDIRDEIETLSAKIAEMIDSRAVRAAQRVLDGTDLADHDLKAAQARLSEVEEIMSTAQDVLSSLDVAKDNAEEVLKASARRVEKAAGAVLATKAADVEKRILEALADLGPLFTLLIFLSNRDQTWPPTEEQRARERLLNNPFIRMPGWGKSDNDAEVAGTIEPWESAFHALMADAKAPLPEV